MRRAPRGVHACGFLRASPPGVTARAVDRPSGGNSFDVACGVVIGVGLVAADGAGKHPPAARPRLGIAVPARRAPLGGAGRRNQPQLRPELGRLVGKLPAPLVRAVVKDAAVQPCLGPYASAGSQGGALGALGHALHPQVFDPDPAVALGQVGGELVGEVQPSARLPRLETGDLGDGAAQPAGVAAAVVALGPADLAGLAALQPKQPPLLPRGEGGRQQPRRGLVGDVGRARHAEVDPAAG